MNDKTVEVSDCCYNHSKWQSARTLSRTIANKRDRSTAIFSAKVAQKWNDQSKIEQLTSILDPILKKPHFGKKIIDVENSSPVFNRIMTQKIEKITLSIGIFNIFGLSRIQSKEPKQRLFNLKVIYRYNNLNSDIDEWIQCCSFQKRYHGI